MHQGSLVQGALVSLRKVAFVRTKIGSIRGESMCPQHDPCLYSWLVKMKRKVMKSSMIVSVFEDAGLGS